MDGHSFGSLVKCQRLINTNKLLILSPIAPIVPQQKHQIRTKNFGFPERLCFDEASFQTTFCPLIYTTTKAQQILRKEIPTRRIRR